MSEAGLMIPEDRWFTNLHTKGNTGSASIFIMLEEALNGGGSSSGERILLMVPESGRFTVSFVHLTCVDGSRRRLSLALSTTFPGRSRAEPSLPKMLRPRGALAGRGVGPGLGGVRTTADDRPDCRSHRSPRRRQSTTIDSLLRNLRQQVMEGARWITRAASSLSVEHTDIRAEFIHHAAEEQRDFRMLERDYVAVGGSLAEIQAGAKERRVGGPFRLHVPVRRPNPIRSTCWGRCTSSKD